MKAKSVFKSWTLHFNTYLMAVGATLLTLPDVVSQPQVQAVISLIPASARHYVGTAVTIVGAINFLLRLKTRQPAAWVAPAGTVTDGVAIGQQDAK